MCEPLPMMSNLSSELTPKPRRLTPKSRRQVIAGSSGCDPIWQIAAHDLSESLPFSTRITFHWPWRAFSALRG